MKKRVLAVMPMVSLFIFLVVGLYLDKWLLGATAFLLIPLSVILLTGNPWKRLSESMPLIALTVFLVLGFGFNAWNPGWVVFLSIPLVNMLMEGRLQPRKLVGIGIAVIYVLLGLFTNLGWHPTWLIFLLIPIINTLFFPQKFAYMNINGQTIKDKFKKIIIDHEEDAD